MKTPSVPRGLKACATLLAVLTLELQAGPVIEWHQDDRKGVSFSFTGLLDGTANFASTYGGTFDSPSGLWSLEVHSSTFELVTDPSSGSWAASHMGPLTNGSYNGTSGFSFGGIGYGDALVSLPESSGELIIAGDPSQYVGHYGVTLWSAEDMADLRTWTYSVGASVTNPAVPDSSQSGYALAVALALSLVVFRVRGSA